jgi:3',5'-cyclic AMP phosphodiesterase CpdA
MLEYANWKRSVEPFACYFPFVAAFGNHESLMYYFRHGDKRAIIDRFPFETKSAEAIFARNFVNPSNGPRSEDGASYDTDPNAVNFPPYDENVFYYSYANISMISLNSDYWFSPTIERAPEIGGNLHGYLMDNQLLWLKSALEKLEGDENIDHVFVTLHTPILPNGGHVEDDMWYNGNNSFRPYVAGEPVDKGIIERRDQLLDLLMNYSTKVVAALTGDEHNYNRLRLTGDVQIYLDDYKGDHLTEFRPIWLINNGAGGAPYYGKEDTPWMSWLEVFSTQNAVVFFHVDGESITVEVINPDTMELIDQFQM